MAVGMVMFCWPFHLLSPVWNTSTAAGWIGTDVHCAQRMNANDFGDPVIYQQAAPQGQKFSFSDTFIRECTNMYQAC